MNNDLISRSALLSEYDRVHVGPPGGARKLIEEGRHFYDAKTIIAITKYLLMKDKNMGIAIDPETFTEGNFYNFKKKWKREPSPFPRRDI